MERDEGHYIIVKLAAASPHCAPIYASKHITPKSTIGDFPESMQPHLLLLISFSLFMSHYLSADMLVSTLPTHLPVKLLSGCKDLGKKYDGRGLDKRSYLNSSSEG